MSTVNELSSLISNQAPFVAGNTKNCILEWQKITSDPVILDYVSHCHIEFIDNPSLYSVTDQRKYNSQEEFIIDSEVDNLVRLGVVHQSVHEFELFL